MLKGPSLKTFLKNTPPFLRFFEITFSSNTWLACIDALLKRGTSSIVIEGTSTLFLFLSTNINNQKQLKVNKKQLKVNKKQLKVK